ncbi:hypothetical protein PLESTM_000551100 [Pleodorina starrii]|nr:hypothetical protein PLESTM_000551100 [Pleodorina starrii]
MEPPDEEKLLEDAIAALDRLLVEVGRADAGITGEVFLPPTSAPCQTCSYDTPGFGACTCCDADGSGGVRGSAGGGGGGGGDGLAGTGPQNEAGSCEAFTARLATPIQPPQQQQQQQERDQQQQQRHRQQEPQHQHQHRHRALHLTLLPPAHSHSQPTLEALGNDQRTGNRVGNHLSHHHPQPRSAPDPDGAAARSPAAAGGGSVRDGQTVRHTGFAGNAGAAAVACSNGSGTAAAPPAAVDGADHPAAAGGGRTTEAEAPAAEAPPALRPAIFGRVAAIRRRNTAYLVSPEQDQALARAMEKARRMSDTANSAGDMVLAMLDKRTSRRTSMQQGDRPGTDGGGVAGGGGGGTGAEVAADSAGLMLNQGRNGSRRASNPVVLANTELLNDMVDEALANRPDELPNRNGPSAARAGAGGRVRQGEGRAGGGSSACGIDRLATKGGGGRLGTEQGLMLWTGNKSRVERARLAVRLLQATDLSRTKEDKQIDPYAVVSCEGKSYTSKAVMKSKDPFWDEFFVFDVPQPAFAELKVKVYDHLRCWRPVLLGQVRVPVKSIAEFPARYSQPTWHQMRSRAGKLKGQVQMQLFYTAEWVHRALNVLACTWNVGNTEPPQDLNPWLQGVQTLQHDLVAIGVQECLYKVGGGGVMDPAAQMAGDDEYGYMDEGAAGYDIYSTGMDGGFDNNDSTSYNRHFNGGCTNSHTNGFSNGANGHSNFHSHSNDNGNGRKDGTNARESGSGMLDSLSAHGNGSGPEDGPAPHIPLGMRSRLSLLVPPSAASAVTHGGGVSPASYAADANGGDWGGQTTDGPASTPRSGLATRESSLTAAAFPHQRLPQRARRGSSLMPYMPPQLAATLQAAAAEGGGGSSGAAPPPLPPRPSRAARRRYSTLEPSSSYRPGLNRMGSVACWPPPAATAAGMMSPTGQGGAMEASFSSGHAVGNSGAGAGFNRPSLSNVLFPGGANGAAAGGGGGGCGGGPRGGGPQGKVVQQTYKSKGMLTDMAKVGGEFRDLWEERLKEAVGPGYFMVASAHMGQIRLLLFARNDVYAAIGDVRTAKQATGVAGVATNKGGVGISLRVWETTIAFVNSHLAAHQDRTRARNNNYRDIIRGLKLDWQGSNMDVLTAFHHVVWVGDLNYRLDYGQQAVSRSESPTAADFTSLVAEVHQGAFAKLLEVDQLRREMGAKRAFLGFHEGTINFEPSFKVLRRRGYDYNPQRSPAYCDRILYRSNLPLKQIRVVSYFSPSDIATSDHKPVGAVLVVPTIWRATVDDHVSGGSRSQGLSSTLAASEGGGGGFGLGTSHFMPRGLQAHPHHQAHSHLRLIFTNLRAHGLFMLRSRRRSAVTASTEFPSPQLLLSGPCMREAVIRSRVAPQTREPLWADVEDAALGPIVVDLKSASLAEMAHFRLWARVFDMRGAERGPAARLGGGGNGGGGGGGGGGAGGGGGRRWGGGGKGEGAGGGGGKGEGGGGGGKGDAGGGGAGGGGSVLARGVLPLLDAVTTLLQDPHGVASFQVLLELHGLPAGRMEGGMRLEASGGASQGPGTDPRVAPQRHVRVQRQLRHTRLSAASRLTGRRPPGYRDLIAALQYDRRRSRQRRRQRPRQRR